MIITLALLYLSFSATFASSSDNNADTSAGNTVTEASTTTDSSDTSDTATTTAAPINDYGKESIFQSNETVPLIALFC